MNRAATAARVTTALRFPTDVHEQLRDAADQRGMSMNDIVVLLVRYGLPRLRPFTLNDLFVADQQVNGHALSPYRDPAPLGNPNLDGSF